MKGFRGEPQLTSWALGIRKWAAEKLMEGTLQQKQI